MRLQNIWHTILVAERFLETARVARRRLEDDLPSACRSKETAACRRASMDLTRALAQMRKS